jgi:hypothetical protein
VGNETAGGVGGSTRAEVLGAVATGEDGVLSTVGAGGLLPSYPLQKGLKGI